MNSFISFLRSNPVFFLLLPLFFVFHGFTENFNAIPVSDAFWLLIVYLTASLVIFFLAWLLYKNYLKAALLSFCTMAFHFFFGGMQDLLKKWFNDSFITRYSFILSFFLILFIVLIVVLKKRKVQFLKATFYLNILFCILILIDTAGLLFETVLPKSQSYSKAPKEIKCDSCIKPDIYFLIFDEYSSSTALKELWNYENSELDSFLAKKKFKLIPYSRSNYNFTEFSIASTLNMDWLNIPAPQACTVKDYNNCFELIKNNQVTSMLRSIGYKIRNYSIFDIDKNPSPVSEDFLPLKTKLITSQTFLSRIRKDLFYHLLAGKFEIEWLTRDLIYTTRHNNEKIINATIKESLESSPESKFVYSHIEMPHPPFYYDKNGKEKDKQKLLEENKNLNVNSYLDYLPSTNKVIKQLINSIIDHAKRPLVIILMGDHGFRANQPQNYYFRNLNAVYTSSGNYQGFYENISSINEFRILFNNLFLTSFQPLKDSTLFLTDK
jgi:hypothetical protein